MEHEPEIYPLPGCTVEVHQPFGESSYFALVDLNGRYPEQGKVAHDIGRREYFLLLEGRADLTINDVHHVLHPRLNRLVDDGDHYWVKGRAKIIVFVQDQEGGTTQIELSTD